MNTYRKSFTLLELLVTIAIIIILAGVLIGGIGFATRRADDAKTIAQMEKLAAALEAYHADRGFYLRQTTAPTNNKATTLEDTATDYDVVLSVDSDGVKFNGKPFFNKKDKKPYLELTTDGNTSDLGYTDAWGQRFHYQCPGTHNEAAFDLCSAGPDGVFGNEDDISNWKENN